MWPRSNPGGFFGDPTHGWPILNPWKTMVSNSVTLRKNYIYLEPKWGPLVLIGKGLVLGGWPSKIEVIWVPGIYTYNLHMLEDFGQFLLSENFQAWMDSCWEEDCTGSFWRLEEVWNIPPVTTWIWLLNVALNVCSKAIQKKNTCKKHNMFRFIFETCFLVRISS